MVMDSWNIPGIGLPVWLLVVCAVPVAYYAYFSWYYGIFRRLGIKGPKPIPILGTMLPMIQEGITKFETDLRKYGTVVGTFQGPTPLLMIYDTEMLKQILVKDFNNFPNRFNPGISDYPLERLITSVTGAHWRHIRNHLTPAFSSGKLKKMNTKMLHCVDSLYQVLKTKAENKDIFEFRAISGAFTMDVIASTAFGLRVDSHNDPTNQFVRMATKAFDFKFANIETILFFFFPFLVKPLSILGLVTLFPKDVVNFFAATVDRAMAERREEESDEVDFLQLMVNARVEDDEYNKIAAEEKKNSKEEIWTKGKGLSHEEILAQGIMFFLAGYDTTANTLALFGYEMALNPDVQERLIGEIDQVMKDEKNITYELLQKMPYLEMCLSEVLRKYPSGQRTDRVTVKETVVKGIKIPKGMVIGIPIYVLQNDPEVWPNPEKFDPERFTPDAKESRNPFNYLPFGIGPRNCIGMRLALMELKMAMVYLLQRLKFEVCEETQIPLKLDKLKMTGVDGIKLRVTLR